MQGQLVLLCAVISMARSSGKEAHCTAHMYPSSAGDGNGGRGIGSCPLFVDRFAALRAQTAMPCIGPSTASHPVEHDASWSDPVERLVLGSHDRVDGLYKVA